MDRDLMDAKIRRVFREFENGLTIEGLKDACLQRGVVTESQLYERGEGFPTGYPGYLESVLTRDPDASVPLFAVPTLDTATPGYGINVLWKRFDLATPEECLHWVKSLQSTAQRIEEAMDFLKRTPCPA